MQTATAELTTPSEREIVLTRVFDAPRSLVFDAATKPELLKRWLTAPGRSMTVCEVNLKVGGAYRFVWSDSGKTGSGKKDVGMRGVYREILPPERVVRTEAWEDWDAGETLVTTVLLEECGRTRLTITVLFPSQEVRDAVLNSGIRQGAAENFDKLAEVLASQTGSGTRSQVNTKQREQPE